jgi:hypothetical protein
MANLQSASADGCIANSGWDEPEKGIRGRIFLGWLARIQYAAAMGA